MSTILQLSYLNINGYQVNVVLEENNNSSFKDNESSLCYLNLSLKPKNGNTFEKWVTNENLHFKYLHNIERKN